MSDVTWNPVHSQDPPHVPRTDVHWCHDLMYEGCIAKLEMAGDAMMRSSAKPRSKEHRANVDAWQVIRHRMSEGERAWKAEQRAKEPE